MFKTVERRREYEREWYQRNKEDQQKRGREYYHKNRLKILKRISERCAKKSILSTKGRLVEHHTKYKEIHGVDETVWIPLGEHTQRHHKLRREGLCNIPIEELKRISARAKCRTNKYRARRRSIQFTETLLPHIQLVEEICYDVRSGYVSSRGRFRANDGTKLLYINIWINIRIRECSCGYLYVML